MSLDRPPRQGATIAALRPIDRCCGDRCGPNDTPTVDSTASVAFAACHSDSVAASYSTTSSADLDGRPGVGRDLGFDREVPSRSIPSRSSAQSPAASTRTISTHPAPEALRVRSSPRRRRCDIPRSMSALPSPLRRMRDLSHRQPRSKAPRTATVFATQEV
jgi:hypothetical protein